MEGALGDLQRGGGMCYAEKLLISRQDQLSPMHTHALTAEEIIDRGGATLVVELFGSDDDPTHLLFSDYRKWFG